MADDPHNTSDLSDPIEAGSVKEDSETKTARRELKQTSISEKDPNQKAPSPSQEDKSASEDEKARDKAQERRPTPETTNRTSHYDLKEQVSSPKKKRAHEELDEPKDSEDGRRGGEAADKAANGGTILSRTDRSEPEKKRARDQVGRNAEGTGGSETVLLPCPPQPSPPPFLSQQHNADMDKNTSVPGSPRKSSDIESREANNESKSKTDGDEARKVSVEEDKQQKPATSFASSGFAKLASSSQSPFGALASSGKPGIFGAPSSGSQSPFGALATSQPSAAPKLSFGSAAGSPSPFGAVASANPGSASETPKLSFASSAGASPFGASGLNGKPSSFGGGGVLGGGFASSSAFGGGLLTSFASKASEAHPSEKPARPFGAPESEDEGSEVGDEESESEDKADAASDKADDKDKEESKQHADEKKKLKLQKGKLHGTGRGHARTPPTSKHALVTNSSD